MEKTDNKQPNVTKPVSCGIYKAFCVKMDDGTIQVKALDPSIEEHNELNRHWWGEIHQGLSCR